MWGNIYYLLLCEEIFTNLIIIITSEIIQEYIFQKVQGKYVTNWKQ